MDLIVAKLGFGLAVLLAGALGAALPLRAGGAPDRRWLGRGNALAAGIFLGAGLVHMLPDAREAWGELGFDYPVAELLAASAVVAMLLFEHVLIPESAHEAVHAPPGEAFGHGEGGAPRGVGAYAVVFGLVIHSFLAGLALGAQPALGGAVVIFAAILAHKTSAGFALGVSLVRNHVARRRALGLAGLFAVATPAGILVGAVVDDALDGPTRVAFEATFLGLAAGTFAYVATLDILRDEFHGPGSRLGKWALVAAGTAAMALLALVV